MLEDPLLWRWVLRLAKQNPVALLIVSYLFSWTRNLPQVNPMRQLVRHLNWIPCLRTMPCQVHCPVHLQIHVVAEHQDVLALGSHPWTPGAVVCPWPAGVQNPWERVEFSGEHKLHKGSFLSAFDVVGYEGAYSYSGMKRPFPVWHCASLSA